MGWRKCVDRANERSPIGWRWGVHPSVPLGDVGREGLEVRGLADG